MLFLLLTLEAFEMLSQEGEELYRFVLVLRAYLFSSSSL